MAGRGVSTKKVEFDVMRVEVQRGSGGSIEDCIGVKMGMESFPPI